MQQHKDESMHSIGYGIYILIWLGLVVFTGLTVAVAGIHLRELTVTTALLIASVKTLLVVFFFMHVRYEPILFKLMISVCLITFVIFIVLTFFDVLFR